MLDYTLEKKEIAQKIASNRGLEVFQIKPADFRDVGARHIRDCVYPHISTWLYAFSHSSYIITDSFHGTVFSIIFEKPFLTFGNTKRGMDRMISLLEMCDLKDRLFGESFLENEIDYKRVFERIEEE